MSDSYFIGTVSRVHKLWRIPRPLPRDTKNGNGTSASSNKTPALPSLPPLPKSEDTVIDDDVLAALRDGDEEQRKQGMEEYVQNRLRGSPKKKLRPQVGMMVSLDHTIYFHNPRAFRADEWIFTEMESPWAGDGRGLVYQKMWTRSGKLIASCVQEGVVRLKPETESSKL